MRITRQLFVSRKKRIKFLMDKLTYKDLPLNAPALSDVEVVKLTGRPEPGQKQRKPLPPELADDPRFYVPPKGEEKKNYRETPAFLYNRNCRFIEGTKQACFLTKSVRYDGMPESVRQLIDKFEVPDESRLVQKAILKSQIWDSTREKLPKRRDPEYPRYKIDREYGIPLEKRLNMLSFDLLRMADTAIASQYPEIGRSRRLIFYPNGMATFFKYSDSLLSFYLGIDAAITSTSPLPPFVPEELVESSSSEAIPSLYPISPTIDFLKTNNYNLKNSIGFSEISCKFPHTLILLNNDDWSEDERQARALVTAMGLAVAQVKKTYPGIKDRLPTPISVQVINMSETTMNFTYFQLNTIDFDNSEAGVKNFVWFDTGNVLFERRLPQPWKRDKILETSLENLDLDPFKKLLATVGNCAELEDSSTQFKEKLIEL